jgi:hypothetical protein
MLYVYIYGAPCKARNSSIVYIHIYIQGAKFLVARSPLTTKYFSLAVGIWPFFFSKLDLCEKKWRPNSLIWLQDSDLKFYALCVCVCVCVCVYIYIYLHLATLKAVSFYLLHNVSTLNRCIKLSCGTVVCKHFASYQAYPNYRWDLIRYAEG